MIKCVLLLALNNDITRAKSKINGVNKNKKYPSLNERLKVIGNGIFYGIIHMYEIDSPNFFVYSHNT